MPQKYIDEIEQLGILEPGESIKFFYSDAMLDIKAGMYFFTDRAVVVYSTEIDPQQPLTRFTYADIVDISHDDTDNFWTDSIIWIETAEEFIYFPVSNEAGGDEQSFKLLTETWEAKRGEAHE